MSLEADAAKARASRATEALARETEDTLLELKREHATRADALRAQLAEAEARLSEARREAEEAEASARAKAEAAEANAREDAESTKKALEAKLRAADADVAEARAAAEKAAADARAEAEFASRKKIAALEARAAEAEAKAAAAEAKAAKALVSSDPEAAARSADAAAARRRDADEFAAADEFADDDSVSGFESIADPDESEAPSASVGSGASSSSSSSSDVSAAVRRSDASATLACVFSFLKDARRSLRERRVRLDRLRREWFLGARALRDVPDASLREGKRAAVSAVRAALDAQAAHFTADARNLRAALVAARSVRDGGAAWEAAFSASVMGERPESVRRTFAEARLEGGYPGAAPTKVEDTHEARARRAIASKRYEQFGEDPLKLLARSTRSAARSRAESRPSLGRRAARRGGPGAPNVRRRKHRRAARKPFGGVFCARWTDGTESPIANARCSRGTASGCGGSARKSTARARRRRGANGRRRGRAAARRTRSNSKRRAPPPPPRGKRGRRTITRSRTSSRPSRARRSRTGAGGGEEARLGEEAFARRGLGTSVRAAGLGTSVRAAGLGTSVRAAGLGTSVRAAGLGTRDASFVAPRRASPKHK
jgi:chemotaxis protein histidine kinase CheA